MAILSERIGAEVVPEALDLQLGGSDQITLTVTNRGTEVDEIRLGVEGVDASWVLLTPDQIGLNPGDSGQLTVRVAVPSDGDVAAGTYIMRLRLESHVDPNGLAEVDVPLTIASAGDLAMTLTPSRVTTRWRRAAVEVNLANQSNSERDLRLLASNPADALDLRLAEELVNVRRQDGTNVKLEVRPRRRRLIAPVEEFPFAVRALPSDNPLAEPLAGSEGVLEYHPPLGFLLVLPVWLRWLLAALVALLLLLLLSALLIKIGEQLLPKPEPTPVATTAPAPAPPTIVPAPATAAPPAVTPTTAATTVAAPPLPTIDKFDLVEDPNARGQFILSWQVEGADKVTVANEDITDTRRVGEGTKKVTPGPNGAEFILLASKGDTTARKTIGLVILHKPEVKLTASKTTAESGESITLNWEVAGAERAELDGVQLPPGNGSTVVQVGDGTNTFRLIAENDLGRTETSVDVTVQPAPTV